MYSEIILAGFGGQGVLLIGKMLAYAGMKAGNEVTWMPAYGPEMRGGTCNCTVVLSDKPIGSPITRSPHALIVLNLPSLDKFEASVRPGGVIVTNTSLINRLPSRSDVVVVPVAANEIAQEAGTPKAANMVALGAYLGATGNADLAVVREVLADTFASRPKLIGLNQTCLDRGYEIGKACAAQAGS
ncbi:MAG TPA: 2-oxoacid:acceptor oxidoreductase family protein [Thermoanaerobaculaceae bacterium]|nr:2-oxoacid:acceptor oxidoreductase family protein [Thermoanaerobaculaceae bacterium]